MLSRMGQRILPSMGFQTLLIGSKGISMDPGFIGVPTRHAFVARDANSAHHTNPEKHIAGRQDCEFPLFPCTANSHQGLVNRFVYL